MSTLLLTLTIGTFGITFLVVQYRNVLEGRRKGEEEERLVEAMYKADVASKNEMMANMTAKASKSGSSNKPAADLRNIWDFNASKDKNSYSAGASKADDTSSKQFHKSTYYYAHNQHTSGGGYADGLKAEDFVMNGPRLLSKNGVPVAPSARQESKEKEDPASSEQPPQPARSTPTMTSQDITKFLWDDERDVSKVYIQMIPTPARGDTVPWSDAKVSADNVSVKMVGGGQGFDLRIRMPEESHCCHLKVVKLYATIKEVDFICKRNKLILKLTKAKQGKWNSLAAKR